MGDRVFFQGETIKVTCTAHFLYQGATMRLFREGEPPTEVSSGLVVARQSSINFEIAEANCTHDGHYWCVYELKISELLFTSERSTPVEITVL
eukprot:g16597.t1